MRLIARWKPEQESAYEMPSAIMWEDDTPATMDDYRAHELDTHSLHGTRDGGMERHMYPEIAAVVVYDPFAKDWVVKGPSVITTALDLHDPDATDDQITTELFGLPVVYRAKIVRHEGPVN
jgi:hypothetical protein